MWFACSCKGTSTRPRIIFWSWVQAEGSHRSWWHRFYNFFETLNPDPLAVKKSCLTPTRGVFSLRSFSFCQNYHCPWQIDTSSVAMWIQLITLPHPEAQGLWRLPSAKTVYDRYCLPVLDYPSRCGLCAPKCICRFFLMARSMELYSLINTPSWISRLLPQELVRRASKVSRVSGISSCSQTVLSLVRPNPTRKDPRSTSSYQETFSHLKTGTISLRSNMKAH